MSDELRKVTRIAAEKLVTRAIRLLQPLYSNEEIRAILKDVYEAREKHG